MGGSRDGRHVPHNANSHAARRPPAPAGKFFHRKVLGQKRARFYDLLVAPHEASRVSRERPDGEPSKKPSVSGQTLNMRWLVRTRRRRPVRALDAILATVAHGFLAGS